MNNYQTALREVTEIKHTAQGAKTESKITTQGVTAQGAKHNRFVLQGAGIRSNITTQGVTAQGAREQSPNAACSNQVTCTLAQSRCTQ